MPSLPTTINAGDVGHLGHHGSLHVRYNNSVEVRSGTLASRPAASAVDAGTLFWTTDESKLYRSDGATWSSVTVALAAHALVGADHTASGLSVGQVVRASGATTFAWATLAHADLGSVTADQHHAQNHVLDGATHTVSGLTAGHVLRATGAATFAFGALLDADVPSTITRDSEAVLQTLADAKGDIIVATAADTFTRVAVGANNQVLTADSAQTAGVKWAAGGAGPTFIAKTADETVTSSTVLQDDDHFTAAAISLDANSLYAFEAVFSLLSSSAVPDFKFQWVEDSVGVVFVFLVADGGAATLSFVDQAVGTRVIALSASTRQPVTFQGMITTDGIAHSLKLQWAQNTSDAAGTTLEKGSWVSLKKLN